jgi:hypothetical protein
MVSLEITFASKVPNFSAGPLQDLPQGLLVRSLLQGLIAESAARCRTSETR